MVKFDKTFFMNAIQTSISKEAVSLSHFRSVRYDNFKHLIYLIYSPTSHCIPIVSVTRCNV